MVPLASSFPILPRQDLSESGAQKHQISCSRDDGAVHTAQVGFLHSNRKAPKSNGIPDASSFPL